MKSIFGLIHPRPNCTHIDMRMRRSKNIVFALITQGE